MADEEVKSVFKLVDDGSAPLKKISQSYDAVWKQAVKAQQAADNFNRSAAGAAGAPAAGGGAAPPTPAAGDGDRSIREEARARSLRIRGLRLEEQRGDILQRAVGSTASLIGVSGLGGTISQLSNIAEQAGYQMAAFGGSMGSAGARIVDLAGKAGLAGVAFGAAYTAMSKLDEAVGLTDWLSGAKSAAEVSEQNDRVAHALGFSTVAHMNAAHAANMRAQQDVRLNAAIELYQRSLPVVPAEKSGAAFAAATAAAYDLARKITPAGDDIDKTAEAILAAGENTSASWRANADRQAELNGFVERASKSVLAVVPPLGATTTEVKNFNENIKVLADDAVRGGMALSQVPSFISALTEKLSAVGRVENVYSQFQRSSEEASQVEAAFRQLKLPSVRASDSLELLHQTALAQVKGLDLTGFTPEMTKSLVEKAFAKIDMAKSKVNVNFNNPRFDIRQNFAEGFDPDRIAVAFTRDVVALGETRLQSGLAPIYSGR